jgi:hypothetical protein
MCRRLLLLTAILGLVVLVVQLAVLPVLHPKPSITRANYDRIEKGMTAEEVRGILGPEGYHAKRHIIIPMTGVMFRRSWVSDEAVITISFCPEGDAPSMPPFEEWRVTHKHYGELPPEPFQERLRRLLPW